MKSDYVAEILRATGTLRAGDPAGVAAVIQAALAAGGLGRAGTPVAGAAAEDGGPRRASGERRRRPLGEVLRTLRDGRRRLGLDRTVPRLPPRIPDLPLPEGAEFRDLAFACTAGSRRYRLYVPASASDAPQGLVVMLHGCTQSPEDFAAGTCMNDLAEEHRLLVAYPAQTTGDNALSCWNWFRPGDQTRGIGEPAIIAGLTTEIRDAFAVPADRVFVAGLSAGGAMAAIMAEAYPDVYAAVGIHSGLACGSASDVVSAFGAMRGQSGGSLPAASRSAGERPRLIVFHGTADATVDPVNADRIMAWHGNAGPVRRTVQPPAAGRRGFTRVVRDDPRGVAAECWMVEGAQHAWSGGSARGSYTDPEGPDASRAMVLFFLGLCPEGYRA